MYAMEERIKDNETILQRNLNPIFINRAVGIGEGCEDSLIFGLKP